MRYAGVIYHMRVLLLGASGLLGHNVLQTLVADGHKVVALVRRADSIKLEQAGFDIVVGRLDNADDLERAANGCDAIVNCAGVTDMSLLHRADYTAINTTLCATLLDVMKHHGIRTLVHTSTVNTIGYGSHEAKADERAEIQKPFLGSYYADSKRAGEDILLKATQDEFADSHIVVINPGFMIGSMDVKPSSGRLLLAAYRRRLMAAPRGGKAFVHVKDVARAVANALTRGGNGERYIVVSEHGCFGIKQLYEMQARVMGYRQRVLTLPNWMLSVAGVVGDMVRALGIRTELSTRNVRQLMVSEYYTNHHAMSDLQITDTPIEEAIKDFYQWRENQ